MFFTRDVIEYLAKCDNYNYSEPDDREITKHAYYGYGAKFESQCISYKNIHLDINEKRFNFIHKPFYLWIVQNPDDIEFHENITHIDKSDVIQIRTRNPYHGDYKKLEIREQIDPRIHRTLFFKYYIV
jgi:hypothetical protein